MAGIIKGDYPADSTALTVTNLHSLAASQDWTAGWGSGVISLVSGEYEDIFISASFTTHASNRQAGEIRVYVIAPISIASGTPTWPAASSGTIGTEGAVAFTDTEERDAACALLDKLIVDNTASAVMPFPMKAIAHLFGGRPPPAVVLFVSHNASTTTTAGLAAAGSAVHHTPIQSQYT